jgi:hypothetical protein
LAFRWGFFVRQGTAGQGRAGQLQRVRSSAWRLAGTNEESRKRGRIGELYPRHEHMRNFEFEYSTREGRLKSHGQYWSRKGSTDYGGFTEYWTGLIKPDYRSGLAGPAEAEEVRGCLLVGGRQLASGNWPRWCHFKISLTALAQQSAHNAQSSPPPRHSEYWCE